MYCELGSLHGAVSHTQCSAKKARKIWRLTDQILNADFAVATRNGGGNPYCILKVDKMLEIGVNKKKQIYQQTLDGSFLF